MSSETFRVNWKMSRNCNAQWLKQSSVKFSTVRTNSMKIVRQFYEMTIVTKKYSSESGRVRLSYEIIVRKFTYEIKWNEKSDRWFTKKNKRIPIMLIVLKWDVSIHFPFFICTFWNGGFINSCKWFCFFAFCCSYVS